MYIHYLFFCFLHSTPLTNTFSHSIWHHCTFWGSFCYLLILLVAYFVLYPLFRIFVSCLIYCEAKQCLFLSTFLLAYNCVYFDLGSSMIIIWLFTPTHHSFLQFFIQFLPLILSIHLSFFNTHLSPFSLPPFTSPHSLRGSFCYLLILLVAYFVLYLLFRIFVSRFIYCDAKQCLFLSTFLLAYNLIIWTDFHSFTVNEDKLQN